MGEGLGEGEKTGMLPITRLGSALKPFRLNDCIPYRSIRRRLKMSFSKLMNAAIATLCLLVIAASQNSNFYRGSAQPLAANYMSNGLTH
jgi:hypothetical protein